ADPGADAVDEVEESLDVHDVSRLAQVPGTAGVPPPPPCPPPQTGRVKVERAGETPAVPERVRFSPASRSARSSDRTPSCGKQRCLAPILSSAAQRRAAIGRSP